jgi:hypothetical protein
MKKSPKKVESKGNFLIIDGYYYVVDEPNDDNDFDTGEWKWRRVDRKKLDKMVKRIAKKLKTSLDPEIVLRDALVMLPEKDLDRLDKKLFKTIKKPKITVTKHCVLMKVDNIEIPIR